MFIRFCILSQIIRIKAFLSFLRLCFISLFIVFQCTFSKGILRFIILLLIVFPKPWFKLFGFFFFWISIDLFIAIIISDFNCLFFCCCWFYGSTFPLFFFILSMLMFLTTSLYLKCGFIGTFNLVCNFISNKLWSAQHSVSGRAITTLLHEKFQRYWTK